MSCATRSAAATGDWRLASSVTAELFGLLGGTGRLGEALDFITQTADYTRRAGFGPWSQLVGQGRRLQILGRMGEHRQVLAETGELRIRMGQLPLYPVGDDPVDLWNVREIILDAGLTSALALGQWQWQQCLDLNAEILASKQQRGAGVYQITRTKFNDTGPLVALGRLAEAEHVLQECQQVFEDHRDITSLATALSTRSRLENALGHHDAAVEFARTALRLGYDRLDPGDIAVCHHNLADYLRAAGTDPADQRAHLLAAALIRQLTGMTHDLASTQRDLAAELRDDNSTGPLPATLAEVIQVAEETDGRRLGDLITTLEPEANAAEEALAQIMRDADIARHLRQWEPVVAAVAAACSGDQDAAAQLGPLLDDQASEPDWAVLVAVLRRILGGERGDGLLDGLDPIGTAIACQTLTRLGNGRQEPPQR